MRDVRKGDGWAERGCELATADILDVSALASAFEGTEGVFVLVPPNFDPAPSFPEARATAAALKSAIERARPDRVVYLFNDRRASGRTKPAYTAHNHRASAGELSMPIVFLRPGWFMENSRWDVAQRARTV